MQHRGLAWLCGVFLLLLPDAFLETRQSHQADVRTIFEKAVGVALHLEGKNSRKSCSKTVVFEQESQLIGLAYDFPRFV